jgi:NAD(P)-dependent dehydrogenase (short-subunit alcohol dehydrogenase family)
MQGFKDKVVLITGGNSGIGLATAKLFKEKGANVIITGRNQDSLKSAQEDLNVISIQSDVSRIADIEAVMTRIKEQFGRLDVLFVNAGIAQFIPFEKVTEAQFDQMMAINVKGAFFTVQKALPLLKSGSTIILNASIAAQSGMPDASVYCATKAAVRSFGRTMASTLIPKGIRVNVVSPGPIDTPIFERKDGLNSDKSLLDNFAAEVPMQRIGTAEEVAKTVAFLASEESSYILGVDLLVDGGIMELS